MSEKPDSYHYHEITDRSSVLVDMFEDHLRHHLAVITNPDLKIKADRVFRELSEFYQMCADKEFKEVDDERAG